MKKFVALILTAVLLMTMFAGCGKKTHDPAEDLKYVTNAGKLVVGITNFEPMDYKDGGDWIGFDADMAKAFAEYLGVEVEFVEVDWDNKILELNDEKVDCIWNGMTLTDEVTSAMSCSIPYCNNAQVVVVKSEFAEKYNTVEACKDLKFAVEAGSAGEDVAKENGYNITSVTAQSDALTEVKAGTSDAAIIDALMAAAMVGEGTSYANLTYTVALNEEKYGVGFRKGSDLTEKLNAFFVESYKNGSLQKVAEQYKIQAALIDLSNG